MPTPARTLLFSPDGETLFVGGNRPVIKIWDMEVLAQRGTLEGHTNAVTALAMSESADGDAKALFSASWDGTVRLWRYATPEKVESSKWWREVVQGKR